MITGTLKNKNEKGFVFIVRDDGEKDVFAHQSAFVGMTFEEAEEGTKVTFEVVDGQKGPAAANVQRA